MTSSPPPQLISMTVSPWSERTKFALHVAGFHRVSDNKAHDTRSKDRAIEVVEYLPMMQEPWLRWVLGVYNPFQKVGVPVLRFPDGTVISDSLDIAKWAAARSNGALKIPDDALLLKVNKLAETILACGRHRSVQRSYDEGAYDLEALPPGPLRMLPDAMLKVNFRLVFRFLLYKYTPPGQTYESSLVVMRKALVELREMLNKAGGKFLMGEGGFSIADILAAGCMAFMPLPQGRSQVGPNMGRCWMEPELAEEFSDLLAWRDAIYLERRGPLDPAKL